MTYEEANEAYFCVGTSCGICSIWSSVAFSLLFDLKSLHIEDTQPVRRVFILLCMSNPSIRENFWHRAGRRGVNQLLAWLRT